MGTWWCLTYRCIPSVSLNFKLLKSKVSQTISFLFLLFCFFQFYPSGGPQGMWPPTRFFTCFLKSPLWLSWLQRWKVALSLSDDDGSLRTHQFNGPHQRCAPSQCLANSNVSKLNHHVRGGRRTRAASTTHQHLHNASTPTMYCPEKDTYATLSIWYIIDAHLKSALGFGWNSRFFLQKRNNLPF